MDSEKKIEHSRPVKGTKMASVRSLVTPWFHSQGWEPHGFQLEAWEAFERRREILIQAPTGSGKTLAALAPALAQGKIEATGKNRKSRGVRLIWIAPIRALTKEIASSAQRLVEGLQLDWKVGIRTGDTSAKEKSYQRTQLPEILVTTPESLHVLLAMSGGAQRFNQLECVVVDEWHELMGSKRGVQMELANAWLRTLSPNMMVWGISATIGNMEEALQVLLGSERSGGIVQAHWKKKIQVESLMPSHFERLPWAGHLGVQLCDGVLDVIRSHRSTLIFTNTRAQAEIWYHQLLEAAPELSGVLALHHSSIAKELRDWVEDSLEAGDLQAVVCTSSLDLGVDFRPVEAVVQIGGPKGVARFAQRAGRSGHAPHAVSKIYFLPTHGLELIEASALREALDQERIEPREPIIRSFDVLIQFLCTLAVGDGFKPEIARKAVQSTFAFATISDEEWHGCLRFIRDGGDALSAYPEYKRVEVDPQSGLHTLWNKKMARRHRMNIGTIVSDQMIRVKWSKGGFIGHVEEYFVSGLDVGDSFWFAGMSLEFVRLKEATVFVKRSTKPKGKIPVYLGGRLSLSSELGHAIRDQLEALANGEIRSPEMSRVIPLMDLQHEMSMIPRSSDLLMEEFETDEGFHLCCFPFEGRAVHEAMGMLIAHRWSRIRPLTVSISVNDYGFELLSDQPLKASEIFKFDLFSIKNLMDDLQTGLNASEMAKRRFRDIAVISGLSFPGFPGKSQSVKHLQSHAGLLFGVFKDFDPQNLLFRQAYDELIDQQMEWNRLRLALESMSRKCAAITSPGRPTPFSFPLVVNRLRESLSSEQLEIRICKMLLANGD